MSTHNPFSAAHGDKDKTWSRIVEALQMLDRDAVERNQGIMFDGVAVRTVQGKWEKLAAEHAQRVTQVLSKTGAVPCETEREMMIEELYSTYLQSQKNKTEQKTANETKRRKQESNRALGEQMRRQSLDKASYRFNSTAALSFSPASSASSTLSTSASSPTSPSLPTSPVLSTGQMLPPNLFSSLSTVSALTPALLSTDDETSSSASSRPPALETNYRKRKHQLSDLKQTRDDMIARDDERHLELKQQYKDQKELSQRQYQDQMELSQRQHQEQKDNSDRQHEDNRKSNQELQQLQRELHQDNMKMSQEQRQFQNDLHVDQRELLKKIAESGAEQTIALTKLTEYISMMMQRGQI